MRETISLNKKWFFQKGVAEIPAEIPDTWYIVSLPHSWNGIDGSDGGGDYYRGTCCYAKTFSRADLPAGDEYFLEFGGANSSAKIYLNGTRVASHDGGYSAFRAEITPYLRDSNLLCVLVDNAPSRTVYPQKADFTFYGGLYRNVNLIAVPASHFDLGYFGAPGIKVTPRLESDGCADACVELETWVTGAKPGQELVYTVKSACGRTVAEAVLPVGTTKTVLTIPNVRRWDGRKDPYLYTAEIRLTENGIVLDEVSSRFGCRTFSIDPEKGFFLNGKSCPLHGVSRHQDRPEIGNALLPEHHKEDIGLILEMGANTVRLAHYQHDQVFYDLCDEAGLIVWAEIPYISSHMPEGRENTLSQMRELIAQNYNHPSIVVWGLSNEITMTASDSDLLENHILLNDLAHRMDPTRRTTVAALTSCDTHDPYLRIPDVLSYNHYFGWYGGTADMYGPWFDRFHEEFPDRAIGVSEYGCEALDWHSSSPRQGDYTEEYQAAYHETLIKQLFTRPYLWATHVWNMFDFGADNRSEGGEPGQNHKGLVTFDRKYRKDSFYAYKAWLSDEPFVHIAGKRYVNRCEDTARITVYSNLPEVELFANGVSLGRKTAEDHFFRFEVPLSGETKLLAAAGACTDESRIRKTDKPDERYVLREKGAVMNWFEITAPEGYYSVNDSVGEIMKSPEGGKILGGFLSAFLKSVGSGPEAGAKEGAAGEDPAALMQRTLKIMGSFTLIRLVNMSGMMGKNLTIPKETVLALNAKLNRIPKPRK